MMSGPYPRPGPRRATHPPSGACPDPAAPAPCPARHGMWTSGHRQGSPAEVCDATRGTRSPSTPRLRRVPARHRRIRARGRLGRSPVCRHPEYRNRSRAPVPLACRPAPVPFDRQGFRSPGKGQQRPPASGAGRAPCPDTAPREGPSGDPPGAAGEHAEDCAGTTRPHARSRYHERDGSSLPPAMGSRAMMTRRFRLPFRLRIRRVPVPGRSRRFAPVRRQESTSRGRTGSAHPGLPSPRAGNGRNP